MSYNLLDEKWIPVLWADGSYGRVGIREALFQAGRIRQINSSNPMDRLAVIRFLLALLYWCRGNPPGNKPSLSCEGFPAEWFSRLDAEKNCFNLLGDGKRFYQDYSASRVRPVTDLIHEVPTGHNFWHIRHSTDMENGLCPACCVMGLLRLPLFSVSGLPDLLAGINGAPPVYVVFWGNTLLETLWRNWPKVENIGFPSWSRPGDCEISEDSIPLLYGLTLLPRLVFLHDPVKVNSRCILCGDEKSIIHTCQYQTAGRQENEYWDDPHVLYLDIQPRKPLKARDLIKLKPFGFDRPWHDLLSRIIETRETASFLAVGFASDKAKYVDVWERYIDLPSKNLTPETVVNSISRWQKDSTGLARELRQYEAKGASSKRQHPEIHSLITSIRPHVEHTVSRRLGELIQGGDKAWDQAAEEYGPLMKSVATSLAPGFTTAALQRRKHIAGALPGSGSKAQSGRWKGGGK